MKFTLENPQGDYVFNNYGDGFVVVNEQRYTSSLLIFPDLLQSWPVTSVEELTAEHFELFVSRKPDVLILGTGTRQQFPTINLRRELALRNIQLDVMDTPAACRTYNLLVCEDRDVSAAVLL